MPLGADRQPLHQAAVEGARPYGAPPGAAARSATPRGAVLHVSDTPYVPPTLAYNERPTCTGTRRDGQPCKAKAIAAGTSPFCEAHQEQG